MTIYKELRLPFLYADSDAAKAGIERLTQKGAIKYVARIREKGSDYSLYAIAPGFVGVVKSVLIPHHCHVISFVDASNLADAVKKSEKKNAAIIISGTASKEANYTILGVDIQVARLHGQGLGILESAGKLERLNINAHLLFYVVSSDEANQLLSRLNSTSQALSLSPVEVLDFPTKQPSLYRATEEAEKVVKAYLGSQAQVSAVSITPSGQPANGGTSGSPPRPQARHGSRSGQARP